MYLVLQKSNTVKYRVKCTLLVFSFVSAILGFVPRIATVFLLSSWQVIMIIIIGRIFDKVITKESAIILIQSLGGGLTCRQAFSMLLDFIPGYGQLIGPPTAFVGTWAIGKAAILWIKSDFKASEKELIAKYENAKTKGENHFARHKQSVINLLPEMLNLMNQYDSDLNTKELFDKLIPILNKVNIENK